MLVFGSLNYSLLTYGRVESLIIVLSRVEGLDEEEFDQQKDDVNQVIQSCDNVLRDLDSRLRKFHVFAKDSTPDWADRVRQAWKRIRWDQAEINNFRSRIVANISLMNLIISQANQYVESNLFCSFSWSSQESLFLIHNLGD